jgi:DNA helicase-2/ATP-dependent DNA helicase PcrA
LRSETLNLESSQNSAEDQIAAGELMEIFEEQWRPEWYETEASRKEYQEKGRLALQHFLRACREEPPALLGLEKPFTLVLGQHSLTGKIDRIDQLPNGHLVVYDYKTGQAKETLDAEAKEQLYLYQIALEEEGYIVDKLAYIYVGDWTIATVDPLKENARDAFREKLLDRMQAIAQSSFPPTPEVFTCKTCDFRSMCEFRKL